MLAENVRPFASTVELTSVFSLFATTFGSDNVQIISANFCLAFTLYCSTVTDLPTFFVSSFVIFSLLILVCDSALLTILLPISVPVKLLPSTSISALGASSNPRFKLPSQFETVILSLLRDTITRLELPVSPLPSCAG